MRPWLQPLRRMLVLCLLPSLLTAAPGQDDTQERIRRLQADMRQVEQALDRDRSRQETVQQQLRNAEREIGKVAQAVRENREAIADHEAQLAQLESHRAELEARKQAQQARLANQLVAAYRSGNQDRLKLLLNQEKPESLRRLIRYYDYLNEARLDALASYEQTLVELSRVAQGADQRRAALESERRELQRQQAALDGARQERELALREVRQSIRSRDRELRALKADGKRLEKVLEEVQRSLERHALVRDSREFVALKGRLRWPVAQGRLAARFGALQVGGLKQEGVLIDAPEGSAVEAAYQGRVVFADWLRGYGQLLIVDHGGGYMSLYGHNQSLLKQAGDWVAAGERVATVGRSGGRAQAGLYFALRFKGQAQDPLPWLAKRSG